VWVNTPTGAVPMWVCIYKSPEIEYTYFVLQPPWRGCAEFGNL
jgi:hypothetical protein